MPSRIPMCSFSSRSARRTAPTTLSLLELPEEPPPDARASAAPPPSERGAAAGGSAVGAGAAAGVRATVAGAAPAGAGKEISMKSAPERTSPPTA